MQKGDDSKHGSGRWKCTIRYRHAGFMYPWQLGGAFALGVLTLGRIGGRLWTHPVQHAYLSTPKTFFQSFELMLPGTACSIVELRVVIRSRQEFEFAGLYSRSWRPSFGRFLRRPVVFGLIKILISTILDIASSKSIRIGLSYVVDVLSSLSFHGHAWRKYSRGRTLHQLQQKIENT